MKIGISKISKFLKLKFLQRVRSVVKKTDKDCCCKQDIIKPRSIEREE